MQGVKPLHHIVVFAGDAGGAAALVPVLRHMIQNVTVPRIFGYREAPRVWAAARIEYETIPDAADDAWMTERIAGAGLLLVATSVNGIDWERRAIEAARRFGIPSLALLDFWSNYRARFEDGRGSLALPDRIAVMDDAAYADMVAVGFPATRLVVTGQPALDARGRHTVPDAEKRKKLRSDLCLGEQDILVLYVSQPFSELHGSAEKARAILGYDEQQIFEACHAALSAIADRHRTKVVMAIRRHPRESKPPPVGVSSPFLHSLEWQTDDRFDALSAADLVLGMNSMLLMEAVALGCVVVSVQFGLVVPDPLPSNRDGRSVLVDAPEKLDRELEQALFDVPWRSKQLSKLRRQHGGIDAASNVLALINEMATSAAKDDWKQL